MTKLAPTRLMLKIHLPEDAQASVQTGLGLYPLCPGQSDLVPAGDLKPEEASRQDHQEGGICFSVLAKLGKPGFERFFCNKN